ncbi:MAG TPA: DNA repair protein RecO [Chitinophagaceae bacterium]|jgi:DNA repair protein RecO (recombination protein O)|nr:DNA repair protein RecO [Chitinophagaceae bacterium]
MVHKTKGIVLRTVKYGETSLVVSVLTELFGLQSYMVNGVRTAVRKTTPKANHFQSSAILDLVVYHNEFRNLQRIKEFRWAVLYSNVLSDIRRNAVALYLIELLGKCLKQPEPNPDLYYFAEDALMHLDKADNATTANFPLYFALHLPSFFGFQINDEYSEETPYLDLQEGVFSNTQPGHSHYLEGTEAEITAQVLRTRVPGDLSDLSLNADFRRRLLQAYETYYALHIPDFGTMRTLPILREVLS